MITNDEMICPNCGGKLKYYDNAKRIVRTKGRKTNYTMLQRFRCCECRKVHRRIPDYIFPYKQYESEIIRGVVEGLITPETLGYEDYPCEKTMVRWSAQNLHGL